MNSKLILFQIFSIFILIIDSFFETFKLEYDQIQIENKVDKSYTSYAPGE